MNVLEMSDSQRYVAYAAIPTIILNSLSSF